jgi:hypothetical protein
LGTVVRDLLFNAFSVYATPIPPARVALVEKYTTDYDLEGRRDSTRL